MKSTIGSLTLVLVLTLVGATTVWADAPTVDEVASELVCQCGCNMVLANCNHAQCASRDAMLASVKEQVAQGRSKEEIVQDFVARYGEQVLPAPSKQGFNLSAWLLPFIALAAGASIIYFALRTWVISGGTQANTIQIKEEDKEYEERVKKELEEFGGKV